VDQKHFYAIAGSRWSSFLEPGEPGEHYLLDLTWDAESLLEVSDTLPALSFTSGLPDKLMDITCCNGPHLQRIFDDLVNVDYTFSSQRVIFHELMSKCLSYVVNEIIANFCIRNKMSDSDWYYVQKAKEVIHENLDRRISTPEISVRIGVNEYKLKKLFKRATGYAIDEYRKYHLFTSAAKSMVQSQQTMLKMMSSETGYVSEASLIRAFKTAMFCTPGEMKTGQWDVSRLNTIPQSKWKQRG
jgi:AraC-like DNA-binding protein